MLSMLTGDWARPLGESRGPSVGKGRESGMESRHLQGCSSRLCRLRTNGLAPVSKYWMYWSHAGVLGLVNRCSYVTTWPKLLSPTPRLARGRKNEVAQYDGWLQGSNRSNSYMGQASEAPRVLESKASSDLLYFSPPHPRGGLWRHHEFIMPHPVCNCVHRIVPQFYVSFYVFIPHVVSYFLPVSPLVWVVQFGHRWVCLRYLWLIWGPLVIFLLGVPCCWMAASQKS
jgi:hypothetical protein